MKPYNGKFKPDSEAPYKVSRSKVEDFVRCPRCSMLDRKHGVGRPSMPSFAINSAVDALYKKEFDKHRAAGTVHPVVAELGYSFVPFKHELMDEWRATLKGVSYLHEETNLFLYGALDDVWVDSEGKLVVVDYKATAKSAPVAELGEAIYHQAYRRQLEFYQWLLRSNGFDVSDTAFWLYATGRNDADSFDQHIVFDSRLVEHSGSTDWIEPTILAFKAALISGELPASNEECEFCSYSANRKLIEGQ